MREATISLTGKNSHQLKISLGQGSFSIGSIGMDKKKYDILVDPNLPINWKALDDVFTTKHVTWPRFIYYYGNDLGFIDWTISRKTEDFTWRPSKPTATDFSKTQINRLAIIVDTKIELNLGKHQFFSIEGDLEKVSITKAKEVKILSFYPTSKSKQPYQLPLFSVFENRDNISLSVEPIGQAFDCKSLLHYKNLTSISLTGNLTNLSSLSQFKNLRNLALRYVPNLDAIPTLSTWKNLVHFIGWNIEETIGKRLRTELRLLKKIRTFEFASVTKLRKRIWFTTEYGMPFSGWENKNARKAVRAYKKTLKELKKAETKQEIKTIFAAFIKNFNDLDYIETVEREDLFTAVNQLRQTTTTEIDYEEAMKWFDEYRDY